MSHPYYIGCDGLVTTTNNGNWIQCSVADGVQAYTEEDVIDLYSIPRMDNEDFQILAEFTTICLVIALSVKLIRKVMNT